MSRFHLRTLVVAALVSSSACVQFSNAHGYQSSGTEGERSELRNGAQVIPVAGSDKSSWVPEWKMPSMPWSKESKPAISSYKKKEESTWDKFSRGSKRFWIKTAEVLDPYPEPKPASSGEKKPSMFSSWFSKDEGEKVETVNDFLGQQRID